ncbi:MAG: hypothetical protein PQJ58_06480 [Spirochaetales bacterium]|nr:hypothetical protein [Spirochaetales bacterium]
MKKIVVVLALMTLGFRVFACAFHFDFDAETLRAMFAEYLPPETGEGMTETFDRIDALVDKESKEQPSGSGSTSSSQTTGSIAQELGSLGYDVTAEAGGIGFTGVMSNGEGPTLLFHTPVDAVGRDEESGYILNWLISLGRTMAALSESWSGTLVLAAWPADKLIQGADHNLFQDHEIPTPDTVLSLQTANLPLGNIAVTSSPRSGDSPENDGQTPMGTENSDLISYLHTVLGASGDITHVFDEIPLTDEMAAGIQGFEQTAYLFVGIAGSPGMNNAMASPIPNPMQAGRSQTIQVIPLGSRIAAKLAISVFHRDGE